MYHQEQPKDSRTVSSRKALPPPKFRVGDRVRWFRVPTQDFGVVADCFYGSEGSVQAEGWHYLIRLDSRSPSFSHCKEDYGFEDDLELVEAGEVDAAQ
ncbi:MAG TPA: hypothetical protein V6C78_09890 [Crinalium sp.]